MLTPERFADIKDRLNHATPGPWYVPMFQTRTVCDLNGDAVASIISRRADATFIAHAPEDIANLLAEVERLTKELAEKDAPTCTATVTLRDDEHRLIECALVDGHVGDHWDAAGDVSWTSA